MPSHLYSQIGRKIKDRRNLLGLTQQELADEIELQRTSIANLEAGRQCLPLSKIYELCQYLELEILEVLPPSGLPEKNYEVEIDGKTINVSPKVYEAIKRMTESTMARIA